MKWASRITAGLSFEDSIDEVADGLDEALGGESPDLLVAFASPALGRDLSQLPGRLLEKFPDSRLVGCSGGGIIGDGREIEGGAALSVTAAVLPGVEVTPFHLGADPDRWPGAVAIDPDAHPCFALMPEPFSCDSQVVLRWFDLAYPDGVTVGGLASGASSPGGNTLFADELAYTSGAVGVGMHGDIDVRAVVAQGCRPIGSPLFVTKSQHNIIYELDGRPAVETVQQLYGSLQARDQQLFRTSLFLGLVMREDQQQYGQGDFLIRNLTGIDPDRGSLIVGSLVRDKQVVQFHLRDAETSAEDLNALLREQRTAGVTPSGALLFSCLGRGAGLYGRPDHDSSLFREHFGPVPLGGFFCNGEIGPVHDRTYLHGYTSSFALFSPRG